MDYKKCIGILFLVLMAFGFHGCQSEGEILVKKNMQFVGQFNKAFTYDVLGFGPLLQKITFSEADLIDLAQQEIPEAAIIEDIHVVDVGFRINPNATHQAGFLDIKVTEDSSTTTDILSIEDLFVDDMLIIDPAQLNLGDDYLEMLQNLNQLIEAGELNEYVLDLVLNAEQDVTTDLDVEVIFSFKFSFRACVDVPVGTTAKDCE